MGVRPPQTETEEEGTQVVEFGIAAVDAHLREAQDAGTLTFPATEVELMEALSNPEIPCDPHGNSVALADALEQTHRTRFETSNELLNALHPILEQHRTASSSGVVAWVRSILPL